MDRRKFFNRLVLSSVLSALPFSRAAALPSAQTTSSVELDRVLTILSSDQFRCPGQRWQEYDYFNEDDPKPPVAYGGWARRYGPLRGSYDDHGYCTNMLEASVEYEYGDFGSILSTYIAFDGPCIDYHGVNDDGPLYLMLVERYSERKQLLRAVRQALVERGYDQRMEGTHARLELET